MPLDDYPITTLLVAAAAVPASSTAGVQPADHPTDAISGSEGAAVVAVTDGDYVESKTY